MFQLCSIGTLVQWCFFALKGHCVTFPQDISNMCNELPLHKESMVVFIRYLGNKDTSDLYPKLLRVNKQNVLEALLWLKKIQPTLLQY